MKSYANLMFTPAVAALQEANGSRGLYTEMYPERTKPGFGTDERAFLETRTSIYIATTSETGWPYLQQRSGPIGFLKVLDGQTIAFADFRGDRQFNSQSNLANDDRISIFAVDYPQKARLKLQGYATMIPAKDDPDLAATLMTEGAGRVERLTTIRIVAFDWNCPHFIKPSYTQAEVSALVTPHLADRDQKIAELTARLEALGETP